VAIVTRAALGLALFATGTVACGQHPPPYGVAALSRMRTLQPALREYRRSCGRFPADLAALAQPAAGQPRSCTRLGVVQGEATVPLGQLVSAGNGVVVEGYRWEYLAVVAVSSDEIGSSGYQLRATWMGKEEPRRSFFTDQTGVIRVATHGPAGPSDEPMR
jgi:hypothetical protein